MAATGVTIRTVRRFETTVQSFSGSATRKGGTGRGSSSSAVQIVRHGVRRPLFGAPHGRGDPQGPSPSRNGVGTQRPTRSLRRGIPRRASGGDGLRRAPARGCPHGVSVASPTEVGRMVVPVAGSTGGGASGRGVKSIASAFQQNAAFPPRGLTDNHRRLRVGEKVSGSSQASAGCNALARAGIGPPPVLASPEGPSAASPALLRCDRRKVDQAGGGGRIDAGGRAGRHRARPRPWQPPVAIVRWHANLEGWPAARGRSASGAECGEAHARRPHTHQPGDTWACLSLHQSEAWRGPPHPASVSRSS